MVDTIFRVSGGGDDSILFQGAVSEEIHEGPDGFELGITGGTGIYRYATGYISIERQIIKDLDTYNFLPPQACAPIEAASCVPTRKTTVHVCLPEPESESGDSTSAAPCTMPKMRMWHQSLFLCSYLLLYSTASS